MKIGGTLAFAAALIASPATAAEEEPICADRPGKANPSCTVPPGRVQLETALFDVASDLSGGVRSEELAIGSTAVKFGLTDRLHIEFDLTPFARTSVRGGGIRDTESGFGDSAVALKYRFTGESAPVQAALYPFVKLPTAKRSIGNGKLEGGLALLVDSQFRGSAIGWNIAPQLDLVADSDGSGRHLAMAQVVSIGASVSPRLSVALDLWGSWDWDPAATVRQFTVGPSAAYLLGKHVQLDAGIDLGLNRSTPDTQIYSGIAFRF